MRRYINYTMLQTKPYRHNIAIAMIFVCFNILYQFCSKVIVVGVSLLETCKVGRYDSTYHLVSVPKMEGRTSEIRNDPRKLHAVNV